MCVMKSGTRSPNPMRWQRGVGSVPKRVNVSHSLQFFFRLRGNIWAPPEQGSEYLNGGANRSAEIFVIESTCTHPFHAFRRMGSGTTGHDPRSAHHVRHCSRVPLVNIQAASSSSKPFASRRITVGGSRALLLRLARDQDSGGRDQIRGHNSSCGHACSHS